MDPYLKRTIIKEVVPSKWLDAARPLKIYLPPGYSDLLSYPVIYCQDGNDFFTMGRIATIANQLILEEGMEPVIIVGVSVERSKRTSEYSPVGARHGNYLRFFCEELIPFVEQRYPIRADAASRVLAGDSLGGTVSLHIALEAPQLFANVLSLSGAFFQPTLDRLNQAADLSWLQIWMIVGLDELAVHTSLGTFDFVDWNRRTKALLQKKNARLTYGEQPGDHLWGFWQRVLPEALTHFFPTVHLR